MQWHSENKDGEWHWASEALPNGWSAFVSDYSQLDEPYDQPTSYTVGCRSCKGRKIELRETEREFGEAKRMAVLLAIAQPTEKK